MFKQNTVGMLVLAGAVALSGFAGLAYGQNGKPTTTTPTQVEVVNKTVVVGTATLHVVGYADPVRTPPFDVSPYSVIRVIAAQTCLYYSGSAGTSVTVENIAYLDSVAVYQSPVQRVYDIPGESVTVLGYSYGEGQVCDVTITLYGRRN